MRNHIEGIKGVLTYLGFPNSFEPDVVEYAEQPKIRVSFSFDVKFDNFIERDSSIRSIKGPVDLFFRELMKSSPFQKELEVRENLISERDSEIIKLKDDIDQLNKKTTELEKFKNYYDLSKELKGEN